MLIEFADRVMKCTKFFEFVTLQYIIYRKALTLLNYIKGISDSHPLVERLNDLNKQELRGKALFPDYYSQDQLLDGLSSGAFKKGKFMVINIFSQNVTHFFKVSTENYLEADVVFDLDSQWFVQGRKNMNRAIHGDVKRFFSILSFTHKHL